MMGMLMCRPDRVFLVFLAAAAVLLLPSAPTAAAAEGCVVLPPLPDPARSEGRHARAPGR